MAFEFALAGRTACQIAEHGWTSNRLGYDCLIKIKGDNASVRWAFAESLRQETSIYTAYNVISSPKVLNLVLETGHWLYPEQTEKMNNWLVEKLKGVSGKGE